MTSSGASVDPSIAAMQGSAMQARVEGTENTLSTTGVSSGDASKIAIWDLEDFRKKYPELYKAIMDSLAQEMIRKSQRASDRIVQKLREQRYSGT